MKTTSKYISLLLVLVMLLSTFSIIPASAAETVKYTCSSVSGEKGSNVTVTVKLSSSIQLFGANVSLAYNTSELQYVNSSKGSVVSGGSLNHTGNAVKFSGMYSGKSGTVFTVTFKILKSSGTSKLTLTSDENTDNDGNTYTPTVSSGTVTVVKPVTGITLNKTSATMKKGDTLQLSATVSPSDATNKTVTYKSSNTAVATVSSSGKVTAKGAGTATITATAGSKSATCSITVEGIVDATGGTNKTISEGETLKLSVKKYPTTSGTLNVAWTSSDTSVVTVENDGTITGVSVGTATVTAKLNSYTVTYKITVVEPTEEPTEEPTTEEPTTEEPTEEPTTELTTVEPTTEPTTETNSDDTVSKRYHHLMLGLTSGCVAILSAFVAFFVTAAYYRRKIRNEYESNDEE